MPGFRRPGHIYVYIHTYVCVGYSSWQLRLSIFIHVDILILVSEFVVVVILSEWSLVLTTVGTSLHVSQYIRMLQQFYFINE